MIVNVVKKNLYMDSVFLMSLSSRIKKMSGVEDVSVMMGTPENKKILSNAGLLAKDGQSAQPNDLVIALKIKSDIVKKQALQRIEQLLSQTEEEEKEEKEREITSTDEALREYRNANLVQISIPGPYVRREAEKAILNGKNVFIFSDNVPVSDEVFLKKLGKRKGVLVMGPDCGTAIINGIGLGFANAVPRGDIGMVGAAGTGIQEVTSIIANYGCGISHAIGTGGRDLKKEVGGITMDAGISLLAKDSRTKVIVLVSKIPSPEVKSKILSKVFSIKKPFVILFLGKDYTEGEKKNVYFVKTLEDAAKCAVAISKGQRFNSTEFDEPLNKIKEKAKNLRKKLSPSQKFLRALYSGGTLCNEANLILTEKGIKFFSNVPLENSQVLKNLEKSKGNTTLDMGDDYFTVGTPHPMIDFTKRNQRILQEANDPRTAVILLDAVLGYGAHPDPASAFFPAIKQAKTKAKKQNREIIFITSITGTDLDPQNRARQKEKFEKMGVGVFPTNAQAVRFASMVIR